MTDAGLPPSLTALLDFEAANHDVPKAQAIRSTFGVSGTRYYQLLNAIIDRPEALAYNPALVARLRRQREHRRKLRTAGSGRGRGASAVRANQRSLFDGDVGRASLEAEVHELRREVGTIRRDRGMAMADDAADADWKARVDVAIDQLAGLGEPFTAEDVRLIAGDPPSHPNAMGARFSAAAQRGVIRSVGFRAAERVSLHRHPIREWVGIPTRKEVPA